MRYVLIAPLLLLLAACSKPQEAPVAQQPAPPVSTEQGAQSGELPWQAALPGGVRFDVPAHLRSDVISQTKAGATRRKLTFELLEAGPDGAEAVVTAALQEAGYVAEAPKPGKNGRFSIRYKKRSAPNVTVTYFPELAKTPANPEAKSMVSISWQTHAAPKK